MRYVPDYTKQTHLYTSESFLFIVCVEGPIVGHIFRLPRDGVRLGRQYDNDVVLDFPQVSRHHATLEATQTGLVLRDLGSTNGTWVASRRIFEYTLVHNETFKIGPCVFAVQHSESTPRGLLTDYRSHLFSPIDNKALINTYERLELIGEGGAAYVYKMRHRYSYELAALKTQKETADSYFKWHFAYEGVIGQRLVHPHIVRTFGTGDVDGIPCILMEYLDNGSLRERLNEGLDLASTISIAVQMCLALDFVHTRGVSHRDVKPENIMFNKVGVAKLGDFGIAHHTGMRTLIREGMIVGTPEYISYERAKGLKHDALSDQYSLGIVIYEMLTGQPPFKSYNPLAVVEKHLSEVPVPIRQVNPHVPVELERIVMRTLSKDRRKRFRRMSEIAYALGYTHT